MTRILMIAAVALLLTSRAQAQSETNCEQIRQAVAQYGYEDARRHAMEHYGAEAVEAGEKKCLAGMIPKKPAVIKASVKHHEPKKHKPASPAVRVQESSK